MNTQNTVLPERMAFALRLGVGVVFGLAMAALVHHDLIKNDHPAPWKIVAESTLALSAFIWWAGAGNMRRLTLAIWGVAITAVIAALACHQMQQGATSEAFAFFSRSGWLVVPLLFIAHELVSSGDRASRPVAPYATYFDQAWKHGVQLALAVLFTGLFWVILFLGAALMGFIGFHWFGDLLQKDWVALPLTGAALACGVQLGDVQDKILVNIRALVLSVLSWLLPVITLICLLFLGGLCLSGLEPLWKTKAASVTLLGAGVILVLLINAAYQQGDIERAVHIGMKWAARLACLLLPAFAALATYSLWLRIDQYGLTPERVLAGTGIAIGILFAAGYATAAVWPGRWLTLLERVNVAMAFVEILILLCPLTPLADPMRLSVADQIARLQSGKIATDHFAWHMLRFETGRYGQDALKALAKSGATKTIRADAATADAWGDSDRYGTPTSPEVPPVVDDMKRLKVVYPAGATLPATFTSRILGVSGIGDCLRDAAKTCTVALIDLNDDHKPEIAVLDENSVKVFTQGGGTWKEMRTYAVDLDENGIKAFNAGQIAAQSHPWSDLTVGKSHVVVDSGAPDSD